MDIDAQIEGEGEKKIPDSFRGVLEKQLSKEQIAPKKTKGMGMTIEGNDDNTQYSGSNEGEQTSLSEELYTEIQETTDDIQLTETVRYA